MHTGRGESMGDLQEPRSKGFGRLSKELFGGQEQGKATF